MNILLRKIGLFHINNNGTFDFGLLFCFFRMGGGDFTARFSELQLETSEFLRATVRGQSGPKKVWTRALIKSACRAYRRRKWLREHLELLLEMYIIYDLPDIDSPDAVVLHDMNTNWHLRIGTYNRPELSDDIRTIALAKGNKIMVTMTPNYDYLEEILGEEMILRPLSEFSF